MKDWDTAEKLFQDLHDANYDENGGVEFYQAQIAEETGRYDVAFERYKAVPDGERGDAKLLPRRCWASAASSTRHYLADLPAVTIGSACRSGRPRRSRDAGDNSAYKCSQALTEHPDNRSALRRRDGRGKARQDRHPEARLTRLIELRPDNAQALNALGYTLVDRTSRTAEGVALIERALKLSPGDPFILDSMGWAQFRMGHLTEAEDYLRRALADRQDPEIAAHLGEVLWAKGERARAREVWQSQLQSTPDNPVLLETMRRLAP
jgi:tetratricopeptide (TPR) repeat protein